MDRVATLSDTEYKILELIRASQPSPIQTRTASGDIRRELETINYELDTIEPYNWEETIDTVRTKIYGMLY